MLNGSSNFLNCEEIRYKSVKFRYYTHLRDSKSVRYIRKFVIFEFVVTLTFFKDLL